MKRALWAKLTRASERACHKCKAQEQSPDIRHGMSLKKCSMCSKTLMMPTSRSEHCKQCQAKVKHGQSLAETESRKTVSQPSQAKQSMHRLFGKNRRPQIRTEKVGPANNGYQRITVDLSPSIRLPDCKEGSSASSPNTSKRKHDQAFSILDVNGNAVKLTSDPQLMTTMSFIPLPKVGQVASLETLHIIQYDERRENEKGDENEGYKEGDEKEAEADDRSQLSRVITHSLDYSGMYQRPSQPYLDRLYRPFPRIHNPLNSPKTIPPTIQGKSPLTFEARNRANASNYDESVLDSYFYHGRKPPPGPHGLGKIMFLSNCTRSHVVKQVVQDQEWYDHKQAEIKARGGRKGQWGKIITKEMFEERLANGWNKYQNKPISEKEQKNGDALLRFFGFPENMQPVLHDGKMAMADSAFFAGGRTPKKSELVLGVNMWIAQDE